MAKKRYYGGMISKDMSAQANMPQNVVMKMYPKADTYLPENLDDSMGGIDRDMKFDNGKRRGQSKVEKF